MLASLLGLLSIAPADRLRPEPLDRWDGRAWAGIELGAREVDLRRRFRFEKKPIVPEARRIATEGTRFLRVDVLLDGNGPDATARAIRLEYPTAPPTIDRLDDAFREKGRWMYPGDRHEEWGLITWPRRGVIAVSVRDRITEILLAAPERFPNALLRYVPDATPVASATDPGEGWNRRTTFAEVRVTSNRRSPGEPNGQLLERGLQETLLNYRGVGIIGSRGGSGSLSVTVTEGFPDREGRTTSTVMLELRGETPYGPIELGSSASSVPCEAGSGDLGGTVDSAMADLDRRARDAIRKLTPPPAEWYRRERLLDLYAALSDPER